MSLELIVGTGIIAFLLVYIARGTKEEHLLLQIFLVAIAITLFIVITKGVYDSKTTTELLLNQTVENASIANITTTTYTYSTYTYTNTASTTSRTIYKLVTYIVYIFDAYVFYLLFFWFFQGGSEKILKGLKMKKRKK